jgi:hypothetical protein
MKKRLGLLLACVALGACGGGMGENAASKMAKPPELPSDKQAKCKVLKNREEPLVVEWPDTARGKLESLTHRGLVAVHYEGCELEVLGRCRVKTGTYGYSPITRKQSTVIIKDEDDLYANMPVGALRLEGKLKSAGQLNVQMTIVGRYEAQTTRIGESDLEGECGEATHVVSALTVGSFTFFAGAGAEASGGASFAGAGAGARSTAARETLEKDGDESACMRATGADPKPPEGCGALLQIEVMPLAKSAHVQTPPPAPVPEPRPYTPPPQPQPQPYTPPPRPSYTSAPPPRYEAPAGAAEQPNPWRTLLGYSMLGFGLTSLTAGSIALATAADAKKACNEDTSTCTSDFASKKSDAMKYAVIADVALGITVVSGVVFFLLPAKVSVGPTSNGGAAVRAQGSF